MTSVRVEFTITPFTEGESNPHVKAAQDALATAGFPPENGPLGTEVEGEVDKLLPAIGEAMAVAIDRGASNISLFASVVAPPSEEAHAFLAAVRPVADAIGARIVSASELRPDDVPLEWDGKLVAGLRRFPDTEMHLQGALDALVHEVEAELGGELRDLPREAKQRAVRLLAQRGAFSMRNAAEEVADAIGVSRVTVYNYLNATRREKA